MSLMKHNMVKAVLSLPFPGHELELCVSQEYFIRDKSDTKLLVYISTTCSTFELCTLCYLLQETVQ